MIFLSNFYIPRYVYRLFKHARTKFIRYTSLSMMCNGVNSMQEGLGNDEILAKLKL